MSIDSDEHFLDSANSYRRLIGKRGFSLIELLVVISVVALLLSLMLPVLASSREAVRANQCRGNLRQLQVASIIYIDEYLKRQIPATKTQDNSMWPSWSSFKTVMNKDKNILLLGSNPPGACPSVHNRYSSNPDYGYISGVGYVVNAWWTNALNEKPGSYNEPNINRTAKLVADIKKWDMIRRPSSYPWIMDGEVLKNTDSFEMARYVPSQSETSDWGIGFHHGSNQSANIARADGSVAACSMEVIRAQMPENIPPLRSDLRIEGRFDFLKNE